MPLERNAFHCLEVRDLRYRVRLGVSAEERARAQEIGITVVFRFASAPIGMVSDELRDTVCYAELNAALERHFAGREFNLIERVAGESCLLARELARGTAEVAVRVHKLHAPVPNLAGGAVYACGDFAP